MDEQRNEHRPRTFKGGTIDFGVGTFDCTVRNLTAQGALLDTASPFGLPDRFRLVVASQAISRQCRVVWRRGTRLGVIFID